MHKNAQKFEWKTRSKISCDCTWPLHGKNFPSISMMLSQKLEAIPGQPLQQKDKKRTKRKLRRKKKLWKNEKPKYLLGLDSVTSSSKNLKILISAHAHFTVWWNVMLVARIASCCVANAFSTGLKLILPRSSLKSTEISKKHTFCKKFQESMG